MSSRGVLAFSSVQMIRAWMLRQWSVRVASGKPRTVCMSGAWSAVSVCSRKNSSATVSSGVVLALPIVEMIRACRSRHWPVRVASGKARLVCMSGAWSAVSVSRRKKMVSTMSSRGGQVFPSVQVIQACMSLHWSVKVASGKARIVSMSRACCC